MPLAAPTRWQPCPLLRAQRLGTFLGLPHLHIEIDSLHPTGSLKDRASAVLLARAAEIGAKRVAVASTGNAGSSLAGLVASMRIPLPSSCLPQLLWLSWIESGSPRCLSR